MIYFEFCEVIQYFNNMYKSDNLERKIFHINPLNSAVSNFIKMINGITVGLENQFFYLKRFCDH